jgi:carboxymethylenebutenolidase
MPPLPITTQNTQIPNGDLAIAAYLAQPTAPGTYPGILVIQEIFGVNEHIQEVTRLIAQEGYVAIAPAIFQRQAPGFAVGYTPQDIQLGRIYKAQTQADEILSDLQATIAYLHQLPQVQSGGVGTIGFCFGGHIVYLGATLPEIAVTASFYGAGIANWTPGDGNPTITQTKNIKGKIYAFFGDKDASIPAEQVDAIESALTEQAISHRIFRYPDADHGFFCDRRASYNKTAAQDAWNHVLELFSNI